MVDEIPEDRRLIAVLLAGVKGLFPGYFALVMATGVISIACENLGMRTIALALVAINWVAYPTLCVMTLVRIVRFPRLLMLDLFDHQKAPGFFTLVAGTCVLGTQNVIVLGLSEVAVALWWIGVALWFIVMYAFFTAVTVRGKKPLIEHGINGAWLIASVATQSIVVLRAAIDTNVAPPAAIQFQMLTMFMIGSMLYIAIIPLIFYRLTFATLKHAEFSPPYWINMGAVAISALAGSLLIQRSETWPLVGQLLPFIQGFTVFFWATATWWIPFLFTLMIWRYFWKGDRMRYEPAVWSMIFPLGMYTTSTLQFDRAMGYGFLDPIPGVLIFVALGAWAPAAAGLVRRLIGAVAAVRA